MSPAQILPCGKYISRDEGTTLLITKSSGSFLRKYDLVLYVQKHFKKAAGSPTVDRIVWENVVSGSSASKLAVAVFSHALVLIFDVNSSDDPIIIDAGIDGIENIEWIPPTTSRPTSEGAYTNSRQLALFTKLYLALKVYSLDYTHVLFTVPKPVSKTIIVRPNGDFWTVIAEPYHEKNSPKRSIDAASSHPVAYHFINEGAVSRALYAFSLPNAPLVAPIVQWSPSGKWLMVFSDTDTLSGYTLQVYNSLGVYKSGFYGPRAGSVPIGEPMLDASWLTEGISGLLADSGDLQVTYGAANYFVKWLTFDSDEYITVFGSAPDGTTEVCVFSLRYFKLLRQVTLPAASSHAVWALSDQRYRRSVSDKMAVGEVQNVDICNNTVVVRYRDRLAIFSATSEAEFSLVAVLNVSVAATVSKSINKTVHVFFHTGDHVGVYSSVSQTAEVLHSSPRARIVGIRVLEVDEGITVGALLSTNECVAISYNTPGGDDINVEISSRFQYREDVPKVAQLMQEAQHSEYGSRGSRFKRNRFSDVAFAGRLASGDEITDTFNVKRLRAK